METMGEFLRIKVPEQVSKREGKREREGEREGERGRVTHTCRGTL